MLRNYAEQAVVDPIAAFVRRSHAAEMAEPSPLVALAIDVTVEGGLAVVETQRTYRNPSEDPIEALLTIPVPVHAAFFGLTARIGDRVLEGKAQRDDAARETYEDAIDSGRSAVLHQELLRGIHTISVANVMPGAEMEVTTRWAVSLHVDGARGRLRIPMTLGDVYGVSGLSEPDALVTGGEAPPAVLRVRHDARGVSLVGGALQAVTDGVQTASIPSNAPVDIVVEGWKPRTLRGQAADGRDVSLRIEPSEGTGKALDVAVLVDHSGSMNGKCYGGPGTAALSKHDLAKRGLHGFARQLRGGDQLSLWEFDTSCEAVGKGRQVRPEKFAKLVGRLTGPRGGTRIGSAIDAVLRGSKALDILLITDGLSYALDVQRYARSGRRVFVVLVGEDSLEAKVGHLAALTGGDTHFTFGTDIDQALSAALQGLRGGQATQLREQEGEVFRHVVSMRGNACIEATWTGTAKAEERTPLSQAVAAFATGWTSAVGSSAWATPLSQAVAAFATSLALGPASKESPADLAVSEGLVTQWTSLVLVDKQGEQTEALPKTHKISLPRARVSGHMHRTARASGMLFSVARKRSRSRVAKPMLPMMADSHSRVGARLADSAGREWLPSLSRARRAAFVEDRHTKAWSPMDPHDWREHASALARIQLTSLPKDVRHFIRDRSESDILKDAARQLGIDPRRLVVALLAAHDADQNRSAKRVLLQVLRDVDLKAFLQFWKTAGAPSQLPSVGLVS